MDNVKDNKYYLEKIVADLEFVVKNTKGKTKEEMEVDELLIDSIMFRIIRIAENNRRLTSEYQKAHNEVPWLAIKGMRNRIVQDYGVINMDVIYDTVANGMPALLEKLKCLI